MLLLILVLFITGTLVVAWTVAGKRLEEEPEPQRPEAGTLLSILVPKMNEKTSLSAEMMFLSLHGLLSKTPGLQEHLSFELVATAEGIRFFVYLPTYFRTFVEGQIYAQYPNANISEVDQDYIHNLPQGNVVVTAAELTLAKDYFHPIKTFVDFAVDPLAAITGSVERLNADEQVWMQLMVRPLEDIWQAAGYDYVSKVKKGEANKPPEGNFISLILNDVLKEFMSFPAFMFQSVVPAAAPPEKKEKENKVELSAGQELELKAIENKMNKPGFETALRIVAIGQSETASQQALQSIVASFKQFSMTYLNSFVISPVERPAEQIFHDYQLRAFPQEDESYFVLNTEELASIYHLPNTSVETPTIAWSKAKQLESPLNLPTNVPTVFAKTAFRSRSVEFGIKMEDRRRHMYMIGKTGTGKSTLMENMIMKDILNGQGLAIMDPHGDTIDRLLDNIPENRIEDVVLFDPSDVSHPVSLNMLELFDPTQGNLTASALVDVFKRRFDSWGPRLEYLLRNCFLTLVEVPNTTLLGVNRLLIDKDYRKYIVSLIEDEQLRTFWEKEYANMASNDRLITEAVAPIQNKVGQFLQTSTIRNIVGQAKSTIRIDEIMDNGKIFLINLSKGKLGEDNSSLLGAMIISRLQNAAMTRVRIPEEQRRDFYVYADEFQNFATSSFATILSEARKYRLNLIITHQYIDQLPEEVRTAVFGNVGTTISFTVGPNDASMLAQQFAPTLTAEDMVALEKHHIYLKLMIDGMESRPFSAATLPPIARHEGHREAIIEASRRKYAPRTVTEVEERIAKWSRKKFVVGVDDVAVRRLRDEMRRRASGEIIPETEANDALDGAPVVTTPVVEPILVHPQNERVLEQMNRRPDGQAADKASSTSFEPDPSTVSSGQSNGRQGRPASEPNGQRLESSRTPSQAIAQSPEPPQATQHTTANASAQPEKKSKSARRRERDRRKKAETGISGRDQTARQPDSQLTGSSSRGISDGAQMQHPVSGKTDASPKPDGMAAQRHDGEAVQLSQSAQHAQSAQSAQHSDSSHDARDGRSQQIATSNLQPQTPDGHTVTPRHIIQPARSPRPQPQIITGVPGGIGHTTTINHITSHPSGEIVLTGPNQAGKGG